MSKKGNKSEILGHTALIFTILSLVTLQFLNYSLRGSGGPSKPIVTLLLPLVTQNHNTVKESLARVPRYTDISEEGIRFFLRSLVITFTLISGVLSILAARKITSSLSYSISIVLSGIVLLSINYLYATIFTLLVSSQIMKLRQWKLLSN